MNKLQILKSAKEVLAIESKALNVLAKSLNDDFFTIEIHQDFIKKLVTFKINSQDPSNDPQNFQCRLNNKNTNIKFEYRGITMSANVFPKHVADYNK